MSHARAVMKHCANVEKRRLFHQFSILIYQ